MIVLTIGTFDGIHVGHLELLAWCRRNSDPGGVVVAVNRDDFVERYKGRRPRQPIGERLEIVAALRNVDTVLVNFGDEDSRPVIELVGPDLLVIGDDWLDPGHDERRYHRQLGLTSDWLDERELRIEYVPRTRGRSSTALRG